MAKAGKAAPIILAVLVAAAMALAACSVGPNVEGQDSKGPSGTTDAQSTTDGHSTETAGLGTTAGAETGTGGEETASTATDDRTDEPTTGGDPTPTTAEATSTDDTDTGGPTGDPGDYVSWKEAYIEFVLDMHDQDLTEQTEYFLFHLNDDGVPEMFIDYNVTAMGVAMCTYVDGTFDYIHEGSFTFEYHERRNLMLVYGGRMGDYFNAVVFIDEFGFDMLHYGEFHLDQTEYNEESGEYEPIDDRFFWDGEPVDEADYYTYLDAAYDTAVSSYLGTAYSYPEIISVIEGY